jgi:hypothetical protein
MSSILATTSERRTVEAPALDLRIVPIGNLVPHEEHDHQRAEPLIERIREAGTWLNPPLVAPLDKSRYVILDGANRHYALSHLGYDYILVQVVDYESEQVHLTTWNHVISGVSWFEFLRNIRTLPDVQVESTDLLSARTALARRTVLAYAVLDDDHAYTLNTLDSNASVRTSLLRQVVDTYKRTGSLNRINTDVLSHARTDYPDAVAIMVFPHYQPAEILVAARDGLLLPPGISRHVIQGRAMRLHYPLEAFRAGDESIEAKNEKLLSWMQERNAQKRVRYYAESTYMFDE